MRELGAEIGAARADVLRFGYFGSYARGDWGVGSDVDLIVIVSHSDRPFIDRGREFDASRLPVPADLLVYTVAEWKALLEERNPFAARVAAETVWVFNRAPSE